MQLCDLFDRYRDQELGAADRQGFEAHLDACPRCREKTKLIDRVVDALRTEPAQAPIGFPERIARRAFSREEAWDAEVISLLRPKPALIALLVAVFFFSTLWLVPELNRTAIPGEFEALVNETYSLIPGSGVSQVHTDDELLSFLEQEGGPQ